MKTSGTPPTPTAPRPLRDVAPRLVLVVLALLMIAAPASAGVTQDPNGGSDGGFGWSFLIPAAVIGLVVVGALLAARVGRSTGLDPEPGGAEPAGGDTERTHEEPPA